jgi:competence protein ComEC
MTIALVSSAVVWVWTLPLVVLRFHLVPWVGIVLNVPLVPLAMPTLASAGGTLVLSMLVPPLARAAGSVCGWFIGLNEWLVRWGSDWPLGHHYEPGPPGWWVAGFYGLLAVATWAWWARSRAGRRVNFALAGWSALGLAMAVARPVPGGPEVHVLAVDHGLAVVVRSPTGQTLLYDCGKMRDPGVGRRVVAPALWSMGIRKIDYVVLSHADEDHYDGLPDLLDRFAIGRVFGPPGFDGDGNPGARSLVRQCRERGVAYGAISKGWTIDLGPRIEARVLHPESGWLPDAPDNARSVVLELSALGRRVLLTGDLEGAGQAELAMGPPTSYDVMLAPHHGGKMANPAWFYDWGRPRTVVASQRRPTGSDALEALERQGRPVHRTWKEGAIALRWESEGLEIQSLLGHKGMALHDPMTVQAGYLPVGLLGALPTGWATSMVVILAFVVGLGVCLVWGVVEWGAWALVTPGRQHDPERPDEEPAPWEPLSARAFDGTALRGAWLGSDRADGRTLAILHGFGEDRSALFARAEALSGRGWNVAVLDARGRGQSEGDRTSFGGRESYDLIGWLDVLSERVGAGVRLAAWGRSMGATTVLKAAVEDDRLRAIVLEAPYPDLKPAVKSWLSRLGLPGFFSALLLRRAEGLAGVSLHRPTPIELAESARMPALLLIGSDDPIAPPDQGRRLASAFPSPATVIEVPGARHQDVFDVGGEPLVEQVAAFLDEAVS